MVSQCIAIDSVAQGWSLKQGALDVGKRLLTESARRLSVGKVLLIESARRLSVGKRLLTEGSTLICG